MLLETRSAFAAQLRVEVMHRVGTPLRIDLTFTDAPPGPLKAPSRATSNRLLKIICCPPDLDAFAATEHRRLTTFRSSSDFILCNCLVFLDQNSWQETRTETTPHSCHPWGPMPLQPALREVTASQPLLVRELYASLHRCPASVKSAPR